MSVVNFLCETVKCDEHFLKYINEGMCLITGYYETRKNWTGSGTFFFDGRVILQEKESESEKCLKIPQLSENYASVLNELCSMFGDLCDPSTRRVFSVTKSIKVLPSLQNVEQLFFIPTNVLDTPCYGEVYLNDQNDIQFIACERGEFYYDPNTKSVFVSTFGKSIQFLYRNRLVSVGWLLPDKTFDWTPSVFEAKFTENTFNVTRGCVKNLLKKMNKLMLF